MSEKTESRSNGFQYFPTAEFQEWARETFRLFLGLYPEQIDELLDWGEDNENIILIPKIDSILKNPEFGFTSGIPWMTFSEIDKPIMTIENGRLVFGFDLITSIGWLLSGIEEYISTDRDSIGRWKESNSLVIKSGFSKLPVINIWINKVRNFLVEKGIKCMPLWPKNKKFAVVLTHDIDNPYYSIRTCVKHLMANKKHSQKSHLDFRNLIIKLLSSIGIFITDIFSSPKGFTSMLSIEKELGVRSTIMLSGLRHEEPYEYMGTDPIYDISDKRLRKSLEMAIKYGFPMGMHPSIATAPHVERYHEQKRYLDENLGVSVRSLRHHYWNISRKDTSDALVAMAKAGIEFDTSLGFYGHSRKANFFRRSVALPFTPFHILQNRHIDLIEQPPSFMDGWVENDLSCTNLLQHIITVGKLNGMVVLDWHGKTFNNRWFLGYGKVYTSVLKRLIKQPDIWLTNIEEVGDWWKNRTNKLSYSHSRKE